MLRMATQGKKKQRDKAFALSGRFDLIAIQSIERQGNVIQSNDIRIGARQLANFRILLVQVKRASEQGTAVHSREVK